MGVSGNYDCCKYVVWSSEVHVTNHQQFQLLIGSTGLWVLSGMCLFHSHFAFIYICGNIHSRESIKVFTFQNCVSSVRWCGLGVIRLEFLILWHFWLYIYLPSFVLSFSHVLYFICVFALPALDCGGGNRDRFA